MSWQLRAAFWQRRSVAAPAPERARRQGLARQGLVRRGAVLRPEAEEAAQRPARAWPALPFRSTPAAASR